MRVQGLAAMRMTGPLRATGTDVLNVYADLLPLELLMNRVLDTNLVGFHRSRPESIWNLKGQ